MSILDLGFNSEEEFKEAIEIAAPAIEKILQDSGLADENFIKLMEEGFSPCEILGLEKNHLDALFVSGYQYMSAGDMQKAKDVFQTLTQLDSMDERFTFALASVHQIEGDFSVAGKLYLFFLAMDATNVEGYLRLGECLMAAKEYNEADDVFQTAIALCEDYGSEENRKHAEAMITHIADLQTENVNSTQ